jgi:hypothetical protein
MRKENATIIGVGAIACAACCAGPILGFLAAIGLGTAVGFALSGVAAIAIGAIAIAIVLGRRRHRANSCAATPGPVTVELRTAQLTAMTETSIDPPAAGV